MHRSLRHTPIVCLVVLVAGCQTVRVHSDYDETVDFAQYQTFAWMPAPADAPGSGRLNDILDNRLRRAIENELIADGYQKREDRQADLLVVYHTAVERRIEQTYLDAWGYGRRGRRWRSGTVSTEVLREGTLVVDLIDAERNELVWRGIATGAVNDPARAEKKMFGAVARMFETFPPPAPGS